MILEILFSLILHFFTKSLLGNIHLDFSKWTVYFYCYILNIILHTNIVFGGNEITDGHLEPMDWSSLL